MLQFNARVVDAELPVDPGLFAIALLGSGRRRERGVERVTAVGVQVVAHQHDGFRIPITWQIRQRAHLLRPIQRRAPLGDGHRPPTG